MNKLSHLLPTGKTLLRNDGTLLSSISLRFTSSSNLKTLAVPAVCLSKDGTTFLAYHPQRDFPYEHSRPLPENPATEEVGDQESASPLKVQIMTGFKDKAESRKLTQSDVAKMFGDYKGVFRKQPQERSRREFSEYQKKMKQKTLNELPEQ